MRWCWLVLLSIAAPAYADPHDGLAWLQRISAAARTLNYSGTFVYQRGRQTETSRITHWVEASGEYEKLEVLDGTPREVVRFNDEVKCFLPDRKTVRVEQRRNRSVFPALLPESLAGLNENYHIRRGDSDRVAGVDAVAVMLEPKDGMRFGHRFWADPNTGLLLKARTLNERGEVIEQFTFTQLIIGAGVTRDMVRSRYAATSPDWRVENMTMAIAESSETGWIVRTQPPGFRKISESRRMLWSKPGPVGHIVYSDGFAAVSIFIEPVTDRSVQFQAGIRIQGAITVFTRRVADYIVTVVGEAPTASVVAIGNSVEYRRP